MEWLDRLRALKDTTKETYKSIAEKTEIPQTTIEKLFSGRTKDPKLNMIRDIVHCLGYTLDDLIFEGDKKISYQELDIELQKILKLYNTLNDFGKKKCKDYIEDISENRKYSAIMIDTSIQENIPTMVSFFDISVSAGTGQNLDYSTLRTIAVYEDIPHGTDYILRISGDSMEPQFYDEDFVYVHKTPDLNFGDIGIFYFNNNVYMKKYAPEGLVSLNPRYSTISANEQIECLGKVIRKVQSKIEL